MILKFKRIENYISADGKVWECDSNVGDFKITWNPSGVRGDQLIYIRAELNEGDDEVKYSGYPRHLAKWDKTIDGSIHQALEKHFGYILNSMITALTEGKFKNITVELEK